MWQFLSSIFSKEVLGSKSVSLAFVALLIASLIAAVAYIIFAFTGGTIGADNSVRLGPIPWQLQAVILALFIFSFVIVWFLIYVQYNREAEDIYSRLREKLVGAWQVRYELYPGQNRYDITQPPSIVCEIIVNDATKKLEIHFDSTGHPLFVGNKQVIQSIALWHESENRYSMSYHFKRTSGLGPLISTHVLSEDGDKPLGELPIEIFAILTFEDVKPNEQIKQVVGEWFDLNGNLIRLFSIVAEIKAHENDERTFKKKLSEAEITRDNFAALMGEIKFTRP